MGEAEFLRMLSAAPLAIVDVSGGDQTAFYTLGVREALTPGATLAAHLGEEPAWTLGAWRPNFVRIDAESAGAAVGEAMEAVLNAGLKDWPNAIRRNGVAVSLAEPEAQLGAGETGLWRFPQSSSGDGQLLIGVKCGDIRRVNDVDVWVNSENNLMQMARPWEKSISAYLRRTGSRWTGLAKSRFDDALGVALARAAAERGQFEIGDVVITPAPSRTDLADLNHVKAVAHVAAVQPRADGKGFETGGDVRLCVTTVLDDVARFAKNRKERDCRTILFPLLGTGDAGAPPEIVASEMVSAIVDWRRARGEKPHFSRIYLLAFNQRAKLACIAAMSAAGCIPEMQA
jgi:O-acetyl-ADP-ribose deacetylase (regulator of RNase III)